MDKRAAPPQLTQQEIDILEVLANSTGADFDSVHFHITDNREKIMDSFERLLKLGYILEPREWRYQVTDDGRAALAYATHELDVDPVSMIYAGWEQANATKD
jgi:hypothetical protein